MPETISRRPEPSSLGIESGGASVATEVCGDGRSVVGSGTETAGGVEPFTPVVCDPPASRCVTWANVQRSCGASTRQCRTISA